jgi:hypothetical protein
MPSDIKNAVKGKWGGRRDGAGRPFGSTKPEKDRLTRHINLRVTVGQWTEYLRRGGAKWLRIILGKYL